MKETKNMKKQKNNERGGKLQRKVENIEEKQQHEGKKFVRREKIDRT